LTAFGILEKSEDRRKFWSLGFCVAYEGLSGLARRLSSFVPFAFLSLSLTMAGKRNLRSSKKDGADDTPVEENKPKPTRTRSTRGRKKNPEEISGTEETPAAPQSQSDDVLMETDKPPAPDKTSEDVEMKIDDVDEKKDEAKVEDVKEDTTASPLAGMVPDVR
jgi:hypothetical protein